MDKGRNHGIVGGIAELGGSIAKETGAYLYARDHLARHAGTIVRDEIVLAGVDVDAASYIVSTAAFDLRTWEDQASGTLDY